MHPQPSVFWRFSAFWAWLELRAAAALVVAITALIFLNIVTRTAGNAIFWVDESAIYAMIWMALLAASAAIHQRSSVSVTVIKDILSENAKRILGFALDVTIFIFALLMIWMCWLWFNPAVLLQNGFDLEAFQGETFNFIYAEPTNTLGIRKVWVWLIMPIFTFGVLVHSAANLHDRFKRQNKIEEDL